MTFTFGSLFSGIGGIDLGLERAGMQCKWQVEIDEYAQKVLQKHWPNTPRFRDVRTVGRDTLAGVDLIAGGFPCQPHSYAGKRKASKDERNLWPEFYRIICELKPRWVLGENVLGLLSSEDGAFFGGILRDLAQAGYDAQWCVLRASDVGAPHQRERVFIVAHTYSERQSSIGNGISAGTNNSIGPSSGSHVEDSDLIGESKQIGAISNGQCREVESASVCRWEDRAEMAYSSKCGLEEQQGASRPHNQLNTPGISIMADASSQRREEWHASTGNRDAGFTTGRVSTRPAPGLPQSLLGGVLDGISAWLDGYRWPVEPGREQHGWEPPRVLTERGFYRSARLKILGNAVVPQLAEAIGYRILEKEATTC